MATRREFLQAGIAASILPVALGGNATPAAAAGSVQEASLSPRSYYRVLYDRRFIESVAFGRRAGQAGAAVHGFDGDITDFWYNDLSQRWRREPVAIAGMTAPGPLFCLELWAWDHGLRVVSRVEQALSAAPDPATGERQRLISWVIAPQTRPEREG